MVCASGVLPPPSSSRLTRARQAWNTESRSSRSPVGWTLTFGRAATGGARSTAGAHFAVGGGAGVAGTNSPRVSSKIGRALMVSTSFSCYRAYFLPRRNKKKLKTDSIGSINSINYAFRRLLETDNDDDVGF